MKKSKKQIIVVTCKNKNTEKKLIAKFSLIDGTNIVCSLLNLKHHIEFLQT
jgi:sortase (surface protein transpeptidase)